MALHGDVRVNNIKIGTWSARRTDPLAPGRDNYTYECAVEWVPFPEVGDIQATTFTMQHDYRDGAMSLASKVLYRAAISQRSAT